MADLSENIAAYEAMRQQLETKYLGMWVLIHDREFIGAFGDFESVAQEAVRQFGRGPYLIRQVGTETVTLPASVLHHPLHA